MVRVGDHEDIEESYDGDDGQRRGAKQRRSHVLCQRIGLVRDSNASRRYTGSSFTRKTLRRGGQKPHLIQNGRKIYCNTANYELFVVPGLSTSSSTSSSLTSPICSSLDPTSSSQDSVFDVSRYTENPATERSGSTSEELRGNPLHSPTEAKNTSKNEGHEEVQSDLLHELPDWLQEFRENLVDESSPTKPRGDPAPEHRDTSSSSHELPMESRAKVESGSDKHSVYTHFSKDPNCDICLKTKMTRASCRRRAGTVVPRAENFGDLISADHKILSEGSESRNNHRYAEVVQRLATQWIQAYPCKTNTSQETQKSLMKFLEPTRKPKVIYTDNSLEFGKSCEELSWNHRTSTLHPSETNGTSERAVRRPKEGTSAVLLQSGLDEKWWAVSMERSVQDLLADGKTPHERRFWRTIQRASHSVWLHGRISYFCEGPVKNPPTVSESVTQNIPWKCIVAGGIWKGDILVADIEELDVLDASEIHARRLNAKEILTPKRWTFHVPNRRWNSQIVWRRLWNPKIHLDTGLP